MNAPKPKVRRHSANRMWTWQCGCGASSWWLMARHKDAIRDALGHSRLHTAERVADELERRAHRAAGAALWFAGVGHHPEAHLERGERDGLRTAAALVREHLVKEAT